MMKLKYDYCKISPDRDKYVVEYGTFSTEKKAVRFAKKIVSVECIKKEEK